MQLKSAIAAALPFIIGLVDYILMKIIRTPVMAHSAILAFTFVGMGVLHWLNTHRRLLDHLKRLGSQPYLGLRAIAAVALSATVIGLVGYETDWEWARLIGFLFLGFFVYFIVFQSVGSADYCNRDSCS